VSAVPSQSADLRTCAHAIAMRARNTAWLLGAGASAESHVPTAGQLVDELLLELYARDNDLPVELVQASPNWLDRVHAAYDGRGGLPALNDTAMYSAVFDKTLPEPDLRARFLEGKLDGRHPHFGHHVLAALAATGRAPLVVTTNFDKLIEDAASAMIAFAGGKRLTVLEPDNSGRAKHTLAIDQQPLLAKIHGDLGSVALMNTEAEIVEGDERLRAAVRSQLSRYGLVVAGYSGRDDAVMRMLEAVLDHDTPYPAGLTWVRRPEDELASRVRAFLDAARRAGVEPVHEVVAGGFGELMGLVRRGVTLPGPISARLNTLRPVPVRVPAPMPRPPVQKYPQVRLGAVEVTSMPDQARLLVMPTGTSLPEIRAVLRQARARATVAVVDGRHVAFGNDADLAAALARLGGRVTDETVPLVLDGTSTTTRGLLAESIAVACGHLPGLAAVLRSNDRHQVRLREARPDQPGPSRASIVLSAAVGGDARGALTVLGTRLPWSEAITLSLERVLGRWHLLFAPDIWVRPVGRDDDSVDLKAQARRVSAEFIRERLAPRYTRQTGALMGAWLSLISVGPLTAWAIGPGEGVDAGFALSSAPLTSVQAAGADLVVNGARR